MGELEDVIENPVTGERIEFHETGGELLRFEMAVDPGGFVAAPHFHPAQTEHFTVKEGKLKLRRGDSQEVFRQGEEATIPQGTEHVWWNAGDSELVVMVEFRPADRFAHFLQSLFALAKDGKTNQKGLPNILQMAVMMQEYGDVIYPTKPPRSVQKVLFGVLAPMGRMFGYQPDYPYPSD